MRLAARISLPQVKQCANNVKATGLPSGRSSTAANRSPFALGKSNRSLRMTSVSRSAGTDVRAKIGYPTDGSDGECPLSVRSKHLQDRARYARKQYTLVHR